jgi:hypothetical protein
VFDLVDSIYGEETCLSMPYFTASEKALSAVCCIFGHLKRLQPRRRPKKIYSTPLFWAAVGDALKTLLNWCLIANLILDNFQIYSA